MLTIIMLGNVVCFQPAAQYLLATRTAAKLSTLGDQGTSTQGYRAAT